MGRKKKHGSSHIVVKASSTTTTTSSSPDSSGASYSTNLPMMQSRSPKHSKKKKKKERKSSGAAIDDIAKYQTFVQSKLTASMRVLPQLVESPSTRNLRQCMTANQFASTILYGIYERKLTKRLREKSKKEPALVVSLFKGMRRNISDLVRMKRQARKRAKKWDEQKFCRLMVQKAFNNFRQAIYLLESVMFLEFLADQHPHVFQLHRKCSFQLFFLASSWVSVGKYQTYLDIGYLPNKSKVKLKHLITDLHPLYNKPQKGMLNDFIEKHQKDVGLEFNLTSLFATLKHQKSLNTS